MSKPKYHPSIKALNELQATIRDLRRAYRKDDPFLVMAITNARRLFLNSKRAVKDLHSPARMDHWIGHALAAKPVNGQIRVKSYCKHKIAGVK
jgi:hypothetical protein